MTQIFPKLDSSYSTLPELALNKENNQVLQQPLYFYSHMPLLVTIPEVPAHHPIHLILAPHSPTPWAELLFLQPRPTLRYLMCTVPPLSKDLTQLMRNPPARAHMCVPSLEHLPAGMPASRCPASGARLLWALLCWGCSTGT